MLEILSAFIAANPQEVLRQNKITLLVVYVFESLKWAADSDPEMIKNTLSQIDFEAFMNNMIEL